MFNIFDSKKIRKSQELLKEEQNKIALKEEKLNFEKQSLDIIKNSLEKKQLDLLKKEEDLINKELDYNEKKQNAEKNFIHEKSQIYNEKYQEHIDSLTELYNERINKETMFHQMLESIYNDKVIESNKHFVEEHSKLMNNLQKEKEEFENNIAEIKKEFEKSIAEIKKELDNKEQELMVKEKKLEDKQNELEAQKEYLQEKNANIENRVEERIQEERKSFREENRFMQDELESIRKEMLIYKQCKKDIDKINEEYDGDLSKLLEEKKSLINDIKEKEEKNIKLENELFEKNKQINEEKERLHKELYEARKERDSVIEQSKINDYNKLLDKNSLLEEKNNNLISINDILKKENELLREQYSRLSTSYSDGSAREERINTLYQPWIKGIPQGIVENIDEEAWLKDIYEKIREHEFEFSERLLYSFHTSLKTAEWSPLTVLSGVSGTGKSELPKLYAHFGGFNFMPVSVQPNWDSQEAMLGFFNSIDNKFDAQPLLKFLVQTQDIENKSGVSLNKYMNIILLDEMNLAHIELYFAEFLSKLELRRGVKENMPTLPIKLGVGMEDFQLPLGRNVLWVGTINQDETTKTLSDKVIDRGMIINFPRPEKFARRKKLKSLGDQEKLLDKKTWGNWCKFESIIDDKKIEKFKGDIEDINDTLSKMGRALGNRVWQSIEYYMNNYPVQNDNGLKNAYEDQLVLKVMPKLQGIECRGTNKSLLDEIFNKLPDTLQNDFNNARNNNDGYFYWNSSDYLNKNDVNKNQKENSTDNENESNDNQ